MVTDSNQTHHGDHFEMYRNVESLCCVVGQLHFRNKLTEKRHQIGGYQKWGMGEGEIDEHNQKAQTSRYKINKYEGCNRYMINLINTAIHYM